MNGRLADAVHNPKLDQLVAEHRQRPPREPLGRITARQGDQVRFRTAIELRCPRDAVLRPPVQSGRYSFEHGALADPFNCGRSYAHLVGDLGIGQSVIRFQ